MREAFIEYAPTADTISLVETCNSIIEDYQAEGYDLTLRQLYYQLVSRNVIANRQKEYNRLGSLLNKARLAGLVDWEAIVDRTRNLAGNSHWRSPRSVIRSAANGYKIDKWRDQPKRVEVWIEKDALVGVLERICTELDCDYFSCRGYTSQSEMYAAAKRHRAYEDRGQNVVVLHLGDHDPSGLDMTRDIAERLDLFGAYTHVDRIALTRAQIHEYQPPPNPAKVTDSRFEGYLAEHGRESWELDALEPQVLSDLVREHVDLHRDDDLWDEACDREINEQNLLYELSNRMDDVETFLSNGSA